MGAQSEANYRPFLPGVSFFRQAIVRKKKRVGESETPLFLLYVFDLVIMRAKGRCVGERVSGRERERGRERKRERERKRKRKSEVSFNPLLFPALPALRPLSMALPAMARP